MAIGARKQPLYDQLVDILTEKIDHEYRAGDMIPSERELSERYGLSRTTVRLALQELERLGLVVRQHGRGTFVTDRSAKATNLMQSYSFTEQMRAWVATPRPRFSSFARWRPIRIWPSIWDCVSAIAFLSSSDFVLPTTCP